MIIKKERIDIENYSDDASGLRSTNIDKVFIPENEKEIQEIVQECNSKKEFLTVSGAGTGTVGGRVAFRGNVLSLERMNKIIEINKEKKFAVLQAGVIVKEFLDEILPRGLFYPPFPTERTATIGGNISTNASGEYSFKFGSTRKYVKRIKVVLSDGRIVNLKRGQVFEKDGYLQVPETGIRFRIPRYVMPRVKKHSAGYYSCPGMDLIDLFIGSEGTLGVITEAEVSLIDSFENVFFCAVFFEDLKNATLFVKEIKNRQDLSENVLCLEYFDKNSLDFLRPAYSEIPSSAKECILFGVQINSESDLSIWDDLLTKYNSIENWLGNTEKDIEKLYSFRHKLPELINEMLRRKKQTKLATDIAVPEEMSLEMKNFYEEKIKHSGLNSVIFGHIGESHLHVNLFPETDKEIEIANKLLIEFAKKAVEFGGTVSGEHGIGKKKHNLLKIMFGEKGINEMIRVKRILDKNCILGPDNIFPLNLALSFNPSEIL